MKKVLIVRYGAYGDHIHMSNVIRAFDEEGYHVDAEYNMKGAQIHQYNPRIRNHIPFEPFAKSTLYAIRDNPSYLKERVQEQMDYYDTIMSLQDSLENTLIESESSSKYFWPLRARRAKNTNICYYDRSMQWAGFTEEKYMGRTGEVFFTRQEHENIGQFVEKHKDRYIIVWALRGSMYQKAIYPLAEDVCNEFIKNHPETLVITVGDELCKEFEWEHPNVKPMSMKMPFRQSLLLTKYVDMVITPETGLGIGAGMYGTPKIMLLTAASLKNIVGNDKNDFSLQSDAYCSPCTRAIYNTTHCPTLDATINIPPYGEQRLPICVDFSKEKVLERMEEIYAMSYRRKQYDASDTRLVYM